MKLIFYSFTYFVLLTLFQYTQISHVETIDDFVTSQNKKSIVLPTPEKKPASPIINTVINDLSSKLSSTYNALKLSNAESVSLYDYPFVILRQAPKRAISDIISITTTPFELASEFASGFVQLHGFLLPSEITSALPLYNKFFKLPKSSEEIFNDLEFATLSIETLHEAIATFLEASLLPLDIFLKKDTEGILAAEYLGPNVGPSLLDAASLKHMTKKLQNATMQAQGIGDDLLNVVTTTMFLPIKAIESMVNVTQGLYEQLDMLLVIVSQGLHSSINRIVNGIFDSLKKILEAPASGAGWIGLAKNVESLSENLKNMDSSWLVNGKSGVFGNISTLADNLLKNMDGIMLNAVDGWEHLIGQTLYMMEELYKLEGSQLTPELPSINTPIVSLITQLAQNSIFLNITCTTLSEITKTADTIINRFIPQTIEFSFKRPTISDLNPLNIIQHFGDFTKQLLDIDYLVNLVEVLIVKPGQSVVDSIGDVYNTTQNIVQNLLQQISINNVRSSIKGSIQAILDFVNVIITDYSGSSALGEQQKPGILSNITPGKILNPLLRDIKTNVNSNKYVHSWSRMLNQKDDSGVKNINNEGYQQNTPFSDKAFLLTTQLPVLKQELEIYEKLHTSECSQIFKEFKIFLLDPSKSHEGEKFQKEYSLVCSKTGLVSLKNYLQDLTKTFEQMVLPTSPNKLEELKQKAMNISGSLLAAFEIESSLATQRASFFEKIQKYGSVKK